MITLLSVVLSVLIQAVDAPATCELRGRVTDKESGLPIARAIVRVAAFGRAWRTSRTDEDGRYELKGLTPGEYSGIVDAGEFRATHVMTPIPAGGAVPRRIVLRAGERVELDIPLSRAAAITVRVVDEWGWPLSGVHVSVKSPDGRDLNMPVIGHVRPTIAVASGFSDSCPGVTSSARSRAGWDSRRLLMRRNASGSCQPVIRLPPTTRRRNPWRLDVPT